MSDRDLAHKLNQLHLELLLRGQQRAEQLGVPGNPSLGVAHLAFELHLRKVDDALAQLSEHPPERNLGALQAMRELLALQGQQLLLLRQELARLREPNV